MKSVVKLWETCLYEAGLQIQVRTTRDAAYAASRVEHEGLAFLAITLPAFEKDLLEAISLGRIESNHFAGFRRRGGLPAFLSGFLSRLFDRAGVLRPDAEPSVLRAVRQVLLFVSKIELDTSQARKAKAIAAYVETDAQIEEVDEELLKCFSYIASKALAPYFSRVSARLWSGDWVPRHSSGALATREGYNPRHGSRVWTDRLSGVFPWWDDLITSYSELLYGETVSVLSEDEETPGRVSLVPKTLKSPRVIAMEPVYNQYTQQGILGVMTEELSSFPLLKSTFGWTDQEPNRRLAREGSVDGLLSTLDLSEASDRVSLQLVKALLSSHPFLAEAVLACRTREVSLPDGRVVSLNKFASMGSALCFPIECMVFTIISVMGEVAPHGVERPSSSSIRRAMRRVRVYGDDIIVSTETAPSVVRLLEAFGLKVNARKSFTTGLFRESCGADWFKGSDVSVFKMRHLLPERQHQHQALDQGIDLHNRAYSAGWELVASEVKRLLLAVRFIPDVPFGLESGAGFWQYSWEGPVRNHRNYQVPTVRALVFRQTKPEAPLSGYGALSKVWRPLLSQDSLRDKDHLVRDGRSRYAGSHIEWVVMG